MSDETPVVCFTSATFSYLARAQVLCASVRRFHPDWHMVLVLTDQPPTGFSEEEPYGFDEVIWSSSLDHVPSVDAWIFQHDIVESCTAVKGPALDLLLRRPGVEKVLYLDPDIAVFNSLDDLLGLLDKDDILLTPHQLRPDDTELAIRDNEMASLMYGIYNLGFVAVSARPEGQRFAAWWRDRLRDHCFDDIPRGLFTDQRWCDHVPALFDGVRIVKDPGCNVASWNLSQRTLDFTEEGVLTVNGSSLKFYHVTKFGPLGRTMTERYAGDNLPVYEIWDWYGRQLRERDSGQIPQGYWHYGVFEDGCQVSAAARALYRHREDLQRGFAQPYRVGPDSYHDWLRVHEPRALSCGNSGAGDANG